MMFKGKRKKRNTGKVQSLDKILPAVGRSLNLENKIREWSLLGLWEEIVAEQFKSRTKAFCIKSTSRGNRLQVYTAYPTVASELSFYCDFYKEQLNQYSSQTGIEIAYIDLHVRPDRF